MFGAFSYTFTTNPLFKNGIIIIVLKPKPTLRRSVAKIFRALCLTFSWRPPRVLTRTRSTAVED